MLSLFVSQHHFIAFSVHNTILKKEQVQILVHQRQHCLSSLKPMHILKLFEMLQSLSSLSSSPLTNCCSTSSRADIIPLSGLCLDTSFPALLNKQWPSTHFSGSIHEPTNDNAKAWWLKVSSWGKLILLTAAHSSSSQNHTLAAHTILQTALCTFPLVDHWD